MAAVRTFTNSTSIIPNSATASLTSYIYNKTYGKIVFKKAYGASNQNLGQTAGYYSCDLDGSNEIALTAMSYVWVNSSHNLTRQTIDGINLFKGHDSQLVPGLSFNGYHTSQIEDMGLDVNTKTVYPIKKNSIGEFSVDTLKGKYTIVISSADGCATGSSQGIRYSLLRWNR